MTAPSVAPETLDVSIVLPAHNELTLLGSTVASLLTGLDARPLSFELVIVENGSTDGTLRLARLLANQLDHVRVLTLPRGNYGAALAAGFRAARGEIVVNFDVDYFDLAFLDTALALLATDDLAVVLASKRAPGARDRRPVLRRLLTAGFSTVLRAVLHLQVKDAHGMKAFRRADLAPVVERCSMRGSLFDVEMVLRAGDAGLGVREVPAAVVERRPPRSSVGRRSLESLVGVLWLRVRRELEARGHAPNSGATRRRRL